MDTALIGDLPAELREPPVVVTSGTDLRRAILTLSATWLDQSTTTVTTQNNLPRAASGGIPDNRAGAQNGGYTRAGANRR
jgi:hypothetical protein